VDKVRGFFYQDLRNVEAKDKNVLIDFVGVNVIGPKTYTYGLKRERVHSLAAFLDSSF
jgi:hypothetical protein